MCTLNINKCTPLQILGRTPKPKRALKFIILLLKFFSHGMCVAGLLNWVKSCEYLKEKEKKSHQYNCRDEKEHLQTGVKKTKFNRKLYNCFFFVVFLYCKL